MRIAVNAVSASAGGGWTYLIQLARALRERGEHEYLLFAPVRRPAELDEPFPGLRVESCPWAAAGYARRLLWEQLVLPRRARDWGADVLLCVGNFCPLRAERPVVLLSRNALYFTPRFLRELLDRRHYLWAARHLLMARLALWSARSARLTVTPTEAMARLIRRRSGARPPALRAIPFGVEHRFGPGGSGSGAPSPPPFRFLVVSHYNYYRSFETVFRALAALSRESDVRLTLSARLERGLRMGGYDATRDLQLLERLNLRRAVTMLGTVAHQDLPELYRSAHAVICPSYAESFGQTVLEAMASGVPVIASDLPAHREVAGEAALFFAAQDPGELARCCRRLMDEPGLPARLRAAGLERARKFSWPRHFEQLLAAVAEAARA